MAGRKAHIQSNDEFDRFIESIPEDARGRGYWRIRLEKQGAQGGGVLQVICGFLEYQPGETYENLRGRVKTSFAENKGPGVYFAIPCDQEKKEIKNVDKARFEYKESEVEMPEIPGNEPNPLGDTLKSVKKMSNDMAALQSLDLQQKILNKYLGVDNDKKKEEESVKESAAGQNSSIADMMMWKTFMDDGSKKKEPSAVDSNVQQQLMEAKLQAQLAEMKAEMKAVAVAAQPKDDKFEKILEKMVDIQTKPKDDRVERLLEKLIENQSKRTEDDKMARLMEQLVLQQNGGNKENAFQSMVSLMVKQQEEERKTRAEDEKRREDQRREEERRLAADRAERERVRQEEEKRRIDEVKDEKRRVDEERKEERRKAEEQARLERLRFEEELKEQKRRFDEEMKLRREEMKHDEEKGRMHSSEQQKLQLQLLEVFKDKSNSGLDMTTKLVETMTAAGLNSMKTAQSAAETIMDVAKAAHPREKEKGGGIGDILKDVGSIAGPLLAPYANADAQLKMLQSASQFSGGQRRAQMEARREQARQMAAARSAQMREAQMAREAQAHMRATGEVQQPEAAANTETVAAGTGVGDVPAGGENETVNHNPQEGSSMIAEYLKHYPIVKEALIDNLMDGVGCDMYIGVITGLNQPTLESLIASLRPKRLMDYIKQACTEEEKKLIDANEAWFAKLKAEMILEIKGEDEEEDEETAGGNGQTVQPAPQPKI